MELFSPDIRKFPIFREMELFYISENENPEKLLIIHETELSYLSGKVYSEPWHNGTFLYFGKGVFRTLA